MAYKKRFDTSSAYGQLIILVFLPICVLAAVGGILVFYETMRASNSEQEALAEAFLIRYKPMVTELIPELLLQQSQQSKANAENAQNLIDSMAAASQSALEKGIPAEHLPLSQVHSDHYIGTSVGSLSSTALSEEVLGGMSTSAQSSTVVVDESQDSTESCAARSRGKPSVDSRKTQSYAVRAACTAYCYHQ